MAATTLRSRNEDLHGNAPDHAPVVLLLIDVINDLEFPGGEELLGPALSAAERIRDLKQRARREGIPVIYVNDNFGRWQSDFKKIVAHCLEDNVRGKPLAEMLAPDEEDYFVLKPKHSGFFSTTLDILLQYLGAKELVLTGFAGNNCVLFTANDAYLRDFNIVVPADCCASIRAEENEYALKQMREILKAEVLPSSEIDFAEMATRLIDEQKLPRKGTDMNKNEDDHAEQRNVGKPDKRRGQQMGFAGQPDQKRKAVDDDPALRGGLKESNKMFADTSSQQIGSGAGTARSNSPATTGMTSGGKPGESTGETLFKKRLRSEQPVRTEQGEKHEAKRS